MMLKVLIVFTILCVEISFVKTSPQLNDIIKDLMQYIKDHTGTGKSTTTNGQAGTVYTRWGSKRCGNTYARSELIYAGQVAGSDILRQSGAAVNYLCLPQTPIYGHYDSGMNSNAHVFGTQIQVYKTNIHGTPFEYSKYNQRSIYCAVCRTEGRSSVVMIPGRNRCFSGWKKEYSGYLAAGHPNHRGSSEYICLDGRPDIYPVGKSQWHSLLFSVEGRCSGPLKCPPYVNGRELTCVVCSK